MTQERQEELIQTYLSDSSTDVSGLNSLEIQEIIVLIHSANLLKEKHPAENDSYDEKIKGILSVLYDKIKSAEELFVAYSQDTGYPYMDGDNKAWLFSTEAYALNAQDYFLQQLLVLDMKKIGGEEIFSVFAEFHRLGIELIIIDNGQCYIEIKRDDILPPPDWSDTPAASIPVENPKLQHAMIRFYQNLYSKERYPDKEVFLQKLEAEMLGEIVQARFLIPMQLEREKPPEADSSGMVTIQNGDSIQCAHLVAENDEKWLPVFTDWTEFCKIYDQHVWGASIVTYEDLLLLSHDMAGITINCKGADLRINDSNKRVIEEYKKAADISKAE